MRQDSFAKIELAVSHDLEYFEEYEHTPVLAPDESIFSVYPKGEKTVGKSEDFLWAGL